MSNILGVSCGFHDAGVAVISDHGEILFASHSERYSKQKHDKDLCPGILQAAKSYGEIGTVAYYENHWLKKWRQFRAGQAVDRALTLRQTLYHQFVGGHTALLDKRLVSFKHHKSHAAAGFQTSLYTDATVVVIDAIGEMDTVEPGGTRQRRSRLCPLAFLCNPDDVHEPVARGAYDPRSAEAATGACRGIPMAIVVPLEGIGVSAVEPVACPRREHCVVGVCAVVLAVIGRGTAGRPCAGTRVHRI